MAFEPEHDQQAVLHGPFDPRIHKETFVNYLEVVIAPDGTVSYAVPSHQEALKLACREAGVDPEDDCPPEYYADYMTWLMEQTGYLAVWSEGYAGEPNARQRQALLALAAEGLLEMRRVSC